MSKDAVDELFDVKTAFYLGNFQQAINHAQKVRSSNAQVQIEKDAFMYRSFMAQKKFGVVLDDIKPNAPEELRYIRCLADYLANETRRESIMRDLDSKIASLSTTSSLVLLIIAMIYYLDENYEFALKVLHSTDNSLLECSALAIQIYLKIDRIDLARKELKKLQDTDEDALVTQLANAWIYLVSGEKIQDAFFTFQEQSDKHAQTSMLLNSQAVCLINQGKFEEAQSLLQDALDKDPNNADIMVNMIVLNQFLGKPIESTNRYILQLKDLNKNHPFVRDLLQKENEFNRLAKNYQPSVSS